MNSKTLIDKYALSYAAIITLLYILGTLGYDRIIDEQSLDTGYFVSLIPAMLFLYIFIYFLSMVLFESLDKIRIQINLNSNTITTLFHGRFILYMLGIIVAWIPNLIIRFPGSYDADTAKMILQSYGYIPVSDHHPWFDTLVYGLFWKIGSFIGSSKWGLLLFVCFQMLLSAAVFAGIISYMRWLGMPDKICLLVFIYYAVYPFFPTFTQKMVKDSFHGIFFTVFCLMFFHLFYTRGKAIDSNKWIIFFTINGFLLVLTKKTGLYIALISIIILLLVFKNNRRRLLYVLIPIVTLSILWNTIVLPLCGVAKGEQGEIMSVPSQQVALYIKRHSNAMTDEDWIILDSVYNHPEEFGEKYSPARADAIKEQWKDDSTIKEKISFGIWLIKTTISHPDDMFLAIIALDYPLLYIRPTYESSSSLMYFKDELYPDSGVGTGYEIWLLDNCTKDITPEEIHNMFVDTYRTPRNYTLSEKLFSSMCQFQNAFAVLFSKAVFAVWIPLFVLIYFFRTGEYRQAASLTPYILSTAVLTVGPIVLTRYMVCTVYTIPLVLSNLVLALNLNTPGLSCSSAQNP